MQLLKQRENADRKKKEVSMEKWVDEWMNELIDESMEGRREGMEYLMK